MRRKLQRVRGKVKSVIRYGLIYIDVKLPLLGRISRRIPRWGWASGLVGLIFITALLIYIGQAHAASQGPQSPLSTGVDTTVGTITWNATGNALASDGVYTSAGLAASAVSEYLTVENFGFTIPTGSTINGIQADIEEYAPTSNKAAIVDNSIMSIKGNTVGGTSQALTSTWPSTDTYVTYGGSTNLWGQTWSVSDINSSSFGIAISAKNVQSGAGATLTAYVDYVRVTVYYTPPATTYAQASYRLFNNQDASATTATFATAWGGSTGNDIANAIVQTSDRGYVVAGVPNSFSAGVMLSKFSATGTFSWSTTWGNNVSDEAIGLIQTSDGGYAITGTTYSYGDTTYGDAFIAKFTSTGALSWSTTWGGTGSDIGESIVQTSDGGYAITGKTDSFGSGGYDAFIAKFTSTGALSWSTTWGGTGTDYGYSIVQTSDGGYAITGVTFSYADTTNGDAFIAKFTSTGALSWSTTWGGTGVDEADALVQTSDGGYAITGDTASYGAGGSDAFIAKFTSTGALSWSTTWGGTGTDYGYSIVQTSDGGYAITGKTTSYISTAGALDDAYLAKFTSTGALSWSTIWGGASDDEGNSLVQTSDGGYAIGGLTRSYGVGNDDVLLLKFDSTGSMANCGTNCGSPVAGTSSPVAGTSSPVASTTSPSPTTSAPAASTNSPAGTTTIITAFTPPAMNVGTALAAQDTAASITDGVPFRVRLNIGITVGALTADMASLKLQYAPMTTSCDASFTNTPSSAYQDVTDTTPVRYYENPNGFSGASLTTNANDPTDGTNTIVHETYQGKGTTSFTNPTAVPIGEDGLWDFALETYHALQNTSYCIRVVQSNGTLLNSYTDAGGTSAVVQINLPASGYTQGGYRIFTPGAPAQITFADGWGTTSTQEYANGTIQTSDGGYAVTGISGTSTVGVAVLAKFTSTGTLSWSTTWGTSAGYAEGESLVQTSDGGYAITGTTTDYGAGGDDAFLAKFTSTGTLSWSTTWGGTGNDYGYSLVQTTDGGLAITGNTAVGTGGIFLAKYSSTGTLLWSSTFGSDSAASLIQTSDGGFAVAGSSGTLGVAVGGYGAATIVKFTSTGTESWYATWGGTNNDWAKGIVQSADGGYAITGVTESYGYDNVDGNIFIAKFTSTGALSWSTTWGGNYGEYGNAITLASGGGFVVAGQTYSYGLSSNGNAVLIKFTSTGTLSWSTTWGDGYGEGGDAVVTTAAGGYALGGYEDGWGDTTHGDILLAAFDSSGQMTNCGSICTFPSVTPTYPSAATSSSSAASTAQSITSPAVTAATGPITTVTTVIVAPVGGQSVASPLTNENVPYDALNTGSQFRLRLLIDVSGAGTAASGQSFKLQYARRGSDNVCDASFTGETYADVTTTTPIYYYNGSGNSGDTVVPNANDPTDGTNTIVYQTYQEANNFTNSYGIIYAGESGLWDFSLAIQPGAMVGADYCLRVVTSTGTILSGYNDIVDIGYGPSMSSLLRQGMWWNRSGVRQGFFTPPNKQP